MKKLLNKLWGAGLLALLLMTAIPQQSAAQDEYISEQEFYDQLEPYGTWVYDQQYGNVWVPDVDDDFRPYASRGHWVLTDYGNTWVSDYPWGWATFHYGRWNFDDYYGWIWVPGYEWAPAWVSWRQGGGYYGWAPLRPGISIDLSFGSSYNVPDIYWAFAPSRYINSPNIYNYYIPRTRVVTVINRTTIINNTYVRDNRRYVTGPRAADIQRVTRRPPQVYAISNARRPGTVNVQNNTVNIFRPDVRRGNDARPSRVVNGAAYRQQNPTANIARRGSGAMYDRANAEKLKQIARNTSTNNSVVRINQPGNTERVDRRPNIRDAGPDRGDRRTSPENEPNVAPPRSRRTAQDEQVQRQQEAARKQQQTEESMRRRGITPAQNETQEEAWMRRETDRSMRQATQDGFRRQRRGNEQEVINQQREVQRQQREQQQAQQQQQRRQADEQQRQQQEQQRRSRDQADQQRRQQDQQQQALQRQQQEQLRQQRDQQQVQQRQQQEQQRRQMDDQQRAQREQQRQQQAQQQQAQREQQRQQMQQQRQQQQQQQGQGGERRGRRPPGQQ